MTELTNLQRYYDFLEKARLKGDNFTTRTRAFYKDMFLVRDRRENKDMPLPSGVEEGRRWNDSLHNIEKELAEIRKNTDDVKDSFSDFWSGIGQMLASRKARKR